MRGSREIDLQVVSIRQAVSVVLNRRSHPLAGHGGVRFTDSSLNAAHHRSRHCIGRFPCGLDDSVYLAGKSSWFTYNLGTGWNPWLEYGPFTMMISTILYLPLIKALAVLLTFSVKKLLYTKDK